MTSVHELYELWAAQSKLDEELQRTLDPRGTDSLFALFSELGPRPDERVVDVGCRDARHAIRLVREHRVRVFALDPVPLHVERARRAVAEADLADSIEIAEAAIESLPLPDASADWIWCRDVLVHVDAQRGLAECARVLRPGAKLLAYVTVATPRLEPLEADELTRAVALVSDSFRPQALEQSARAAGLRLVSVDRVGSEWRERMLEDGSWDVARDLLELARLRRREHELKGVHGETAVGAAAGDRLWGVYQLLGKLCPTIYVWERDA